MPDQPINHPYISTEDAPRWAAIIESIVTGRLDNGQAADWRYIFEDRQQKEIRLSSVYDSEFSHGTDGHTRLLLISNLARLLDFIFDNYQLTPKD